MRNKRSKSKQVIISVLALILILCLIPITSYAVQFTENVKANGTGSGHAGDTTGDCKGSNPIYVGYRIYLVDKDKNILTDDDGKIYVKDLLTQDAINLRNSADEKGNYLRIGSTKNNPNKAENIEVELLPPELFSPIKNEEGQGVNLRAWMLEEYATYKSNLGYLIQYAFGNPGYNAFTEDSDNYLVVEPLWVAYEWTNYREATYTSYTKHLELTVSSFNADWDELKIRFDVDSINTRALTTEIGNHKFDVCCPKESKDERGVTIKTYTCSGCDTCTRAGVLKTITDRTLSNAIGNVISDNRNMLGATSVTNISDALKATLNSALSSVDTNYPKEYREYDFNYEHPPCGGTNCGEYCGVYFRSDGTVTECTNKIYYGTFYDWVCHQSRIQGTNGFIGVYKKLIGESLQLESAALGLTSPSKTIDNSYITIDALGSQGYGIHLYSSGLLGKPIHTYDVDNNPTEPAKPETPKPEKQNDGESTIVKVYGDVYGEDSKYYHIKHTGTFVETGTTEDVIIQDEYDKTKYRLTKWVVTSSTSDKTDIKATDWVKVTATNGLDYSILKSKLGITSYSKTSDVDGLIHGEDTPYNIGSGNTIYLLYLRELPPLETSDENHEADDTGFPTTKPTYPENPYISNTHPNPLKRGTYNIVKVYTLLDEYSGTPIKTEVYTQKQTTPFIKIESESPWTLATWVSTNTTKSNSYITDNINKIHKTATTDEELESLYENGYLLYDSSNFGLGTVREQDRLPGNVYFDIGTSTTDTLYIFFTRLDGDAQYSSDSRIISESYIIQRISTSGQYRNLPTGIMFDRKYAMKITYTGVSGVEATTLKDHATPLRVLFFCLKMGECA